MDFTTVEREFRKMQLAALEKGELVPQIGNFCLSPPISDSARLHIRERGAALGLCAPPEKKEFASILG